MKAVLALFLGLIAMILVIGLIWQFVKFAGWYFITFLRFISNTAADFIESSFYKITKKRFTPYFEKKSQRLTTVEQTWLIEHFHFYRDLNPEKKIIFQNRVIDFRKKHSIQGWKSFEVTDEMVLLVCALAVQITFGFRKYYLTAFKRIFVVPTVYYNKYTKNYHKGETSPMGVVVLSWDNLKKGIEIPDDNLNLGLHEFAHALVLQRLKSPEYSDSLFRVWYDKFSRNMENPRIFEILSSNQYFRPYGQTNPMEFFAVATEAFFETPKQFQEVLPNLYKLMSKMYNQDLLVKET